MKSHEMTVSEDRDSLMEVMGGMESVLVAFSGGVDSTLVACAARQALGNRAVAVTTMSPTMPMRELDESKRFAAAIGIRHVVLSRNELEIDGFAANDAMRCYRCKDDLYKLLSRYARERRIAWVADGTHVDDLCDDRPGLRAVAEQGVRSPLREAGLTKERVRRLARTFNLPNWDKPAAACLSSRIPRGTWITSERLRRVEAAEEVLRRANLRDVRVRDYGSRAGVELGSEEMIRVEAGRLRNSLVDAMVRVGFSEVAIGARNIRPAEKKE